MGLKQIRQQDEIIRSFLQAIHQGSGYIEFRNLRDRSAPVRHYVSIKDLEKFDTDKLIQENRAGFNIYFGVCARKNKSGTKEDVAAVTCAWADVDGKDFEGGKKEALEHIREESGKLPFTILVDSGNGYHIYWIFRERMEIDSDAVIRRFETLNHNLSVIFRGDPSVKDLPRILRLPGTNNVKSKEKPCLVLEWNKTLLWDADKFENAVSNRIKEIFKQKSDTDSAGIPAECIAPDGENFYEGVKVDQKDKWMARILGGVREGKRNDSCARLAGALFKEWPHGLPPDFVEELCKQVFARNCNPPLSWAEVETTVQSIYRRCLQTQETKDAHEDNDSEMAPDIMAIRCVKTEPPYYELITSTKDKFRLSLEEIISFNGFKKRYLAAMNRIPNFVSSKNWPNYLNKLLSNVEIIEVQQEEGSEERYLYDLIVNHFVTRIKINDEASTTEEFRMGRVFIKDGKVWVSSRAAKEYLAKKDFNLRQNEVYSLLASNGSESRLIRIPGGNAVSAWSLPLPDGWQKNSDLTED